MARVLLSHAREDAVTTKSIAKALERAGHQVWGTAPCTAAPSSMPIAEALRYSRRRERC